GAARISASAQPCTLPPRRRSPAAATQRPKRRACEQALHSRRPAMTKTSRGKTTNLSRRRFLVSSAAAGGGLALGFPLPFVVAEAATAATAPVPEVNAWVVVKPDNTCVIRIARSEMGQGTLTGLAQLVAEELECDWKKVTTESPTPGENLARKRVWGEMGTG